MKSRAGVFIILSLFVITAALATIVVVTSLWVLSGERPTFLGGDRVGLARIEGPLYDSEFWLDLLTDYGEDSSIRAVVIRIDSPGGFVGPSQELYRAVCDLREEQNKVVVASFGSVAASGGYYVACAADRIVSTPGTLTGSIGVYMKFWQGQDLLEKIGVGTETVRAGNFKDFGGFDRALTDEERQMLQNVVDDTYDQFIEAVQNGRKHAFLRVLQSDPEEIRSSKRNQDGELDYPFSEELLSLVEAYNQALFQGTEQPSGQVTAGIPGGVTASADTVSQSTPSVTRPATGRRLPGSRRVPRAVEERLLRSMVRYIADGKVYTGRQALDIGLVDRIGTLNDAIQLAADLAGLEGKPNVVERKPKRSLLMDLLLGELGRIAAGRIHSPIQYRMPY